jgi:hypothetical protein
VETEVNRVPTRCTAGTAAALIVMSSVRGIDVVAPRGRVQFPGGVDIAERPRGRALAVDV